MGVVPAAKISMIEAAWDGTPRGRGNKHAVLLRLSEHSVTKGTDVSGYDSRELKADLGFGVFMMLAVAIGVPVLVMMLLLVHHHCMTVAADRAVLVHPRPGRMRDVVRATWYDAAPPDERTERREVPSRGGQ